MALRRFKFLALAPLLLLAACVETGAEPSGAADRPQQARHPAHDRFATLLGTTPEALAVRTCQTVGLARRLHQCEIAVDGGEARTVFFEWRKDRFFLDLHRDTIMRYVIADDLASIEAAIDSGYNIDAGDRSGTTNTMRALVLGRDAIAAAFIEADANLERRDREGRTLLLYAARFGRLEPLKLLIAEGADIQARDKDGLNVLDHALKGYAAIGDAFDPSEHQDREEELVEIVNLLSAKGLTPTQE